MRGNRKKWIIISIIIIAILGAGAYFLSPFYTITKFVSAAKKQDTDGMIDCIEPDKAEKLRQAQSLFSSIGLDNVLENVMFSGMSGDDEENNNEGDKEGSFSGAFEDSKIKYHEFEMDLGEKTSSFTLEIIRENENGTTDSIDFKVNFVLIEWTWYIDSVAFE